jgi:uncharacterized protein YxjI
MELYIKQRVFSLGDKYDVFNEMQQPVFHVQGEIFSWGAKIHLYDMMGNELFYIKQKVFAFLPEYSVFQGETQCARIKKEFTFFKPKLNVESSFGNYQISGEFMNMDYVISRDGTAIGEIHKKWLSWGDTYLLLIYNPADAPFFTALAIAVDNCLHNDRGNGVTIGI